MSLTVTTGYKSLVSLGVGVGDAVSLVNLGLRLGNWMTARVGDEQFLAMLEADEFDFIKRKGLIDVIAFNRRWRCSLRLLANGRPMSFTGDDADRVLDQLGRFSSIMVCFIAVLDEFCTLADVKMILGGLLKKLLRSTENGEEILRAQLISRINAWRSTACARGLSIEARMIRQSLIQENLIMGGLLPVGESRVLGNFLFWLLGSEVSEYTTASSDVIGIAACLSRLGLDLISVEGLGGSTRSTACAVVYTPEDLFHQDPDLYGTSSDEEDEEPHVERIASTLVPLAQPEESTSAFPTTPGIKNRCRSAWKAGQRAAALTSVGVVATSVYEYRNVLAGGWDNLTYSFVDHGSAPERSTSIDIFDLASSVFPFVPKELLQLLEQTLAQDSEDTLSALSQGICAIGRVENPDLVQGKKLTTEARVAAFSVFQSFFMGFYYSVFSKLVDTSSLQLQVCQGAWGYRDVQLIHRVQRNFLMQPPDWKRKASTFTRQQLFQSLVQLLSGRFDHLRRISKALPVMCSTPAEVAGFTLLDVDVSGIPRDSEGIVRCSTSDGLPPLTYRYDFEESVHHNLTESSPPDDVTFHIEADWNTKPDSALLCVRYHGRRVATISPASADSTFCRAYIEPVTPTPRRGMFPQAMSISIADLVSPHPTISISTKPDRPTLFQALDRPRLRYAAQAWFQEFRYTCVASNSIEEAEKRSREGGKNPVVIIAGLQHSESMETPVKSISGKLVYKINTEKNASSAANGSVV